MEVIIAPHGDDEIIGKVQGVHEGKFGTRWTIEQKEGEQIITPSHKILQAKMQGVEFGTDVKIIYDGEEDSGKGNPTKLYTVFTAKGA